MNDEGRAIWKRRHAEWQGVCLTLFMCAVFFALADMAAKEGNDLLLFAQLAVAAGATVWFMWYSARFGAVHREWKQWKKGQK